LVRSIALDRAPMGVECRSKSESQVDVLRTARSSARVVLLAATCLRNWLGALDDFRIGLRLELEPAKERENRGPAIEMFAKVS